MIILQLKELTILRLLSHLCLATKEYLKFLYLLSAKVFPIYFIYMYALLFIFQALYISAFQLNTSQTDSLTVQNVNFLKDIYTASAKLVLVRTTNNTRLIELWHDLFIWKNTMLYFCEKTLKKHNDCNCSILVYCLCGRLFLEDC